MGGLGSGRNAGFGAPTCETFPFIDILQYSRDDVLQPGSRTKVYWTFRGEEIGSGTITAHEFSIVLDWCFDAVMEVGSIARKLVSRLHNLLLEGGVPDSSAQYAVAGV